MGNQNRAVTQAWLSLLLVCGRRRFRRLAALAEKIHRAHFLFETLYGARLMALQDATHVGPEFLEKVGAGVGQQIAKAAADGAGQAAITVRLVRIAQSAGSGYAQQL